MIDTTSTTASASSTATVCESMALYGAAPEHGELDSRVVWDEDDAIDALNEAIRVIVDGITVDGTQMADEREALMWGFNQHAALAGHPPRTAPSTASRPRCAISRRRRTGRR